MMFNLFSIFDPYTSIIWPMNWLSLFLPLIMFPIQFWFKQSSWSTLFKLIIYSLLSELKKSIKTENFYNTLFFITIFYMFIIFNFMGLFPYMFTPTSHLTISLPLSLTIWLSIMLYSWINKTNLMFAHLVPLGTPPPLLSFMVLIESISNLIRPGSLAVRLTANMLAGHLILCLLGSTGPSLNFWFLIILIITQIILFFLEMAVAMIQSYVFMTLSSLYSDES